MCRCLPHPERCSTQRRCERARANKPDRASFRVSVVCCMSFESYNPHHHQELCYIFSTPMHLLRHKVGSASKRLEQQRTVGYRGVQIRMRCSTSSCYYTPHYNRSPMNFPVPWMQSFSVSTLALTNGFLLSVCTPMTFVV